MRENYAWNPVFNRLMEIKDDAIRLNINHTEEKFYDKVSSALSGKYDEWLNSVIIKQEGNLLLIHYNQYMSFNMWDDKNDINREARSLTVDMERENIVLCPYPKFFNIGEAENDPKMVKNLVSQAKLFEISEKRDGSNINAAWYDDENRIVMSSSGNLSEEKSAQIGMAKALFDERYEKMVKDFPDYTFMFELIHPGDAKVVDYGDEKALYLIGIRDKKNGYVCSYKEVTDTAKEYKIPHIKTYSYSFNELEDLKSKLKGTEMEGFVLNIDGHRVKYKTDDYMKIFHSVFTRKPMKYVVYEAVKDGYFDDYYASLVKDDIKGKALLIAEEIRTAYESGKNEINYYFEKCKDAPSRKDFAFSVKENVPSEYQRYMFSLYDGKEINYFPDIDNILPKEETDEEETKEL